MSPESSRMHRLAFRLTFVFLFAAVLPHEAQAQRTRKERKKPFASLSESAQRLKDSVAVRIAGTDEPPAPAVGVAPAVDVNEEHILRESVIALARTQIGTRYRLGAESPGKAFDCSGLVRFVMGVLRRDLPRTAHEQAQLGQEVPRDLATLKPGDLLTFGTSKRITHIGIYAGEGKVIHASVTRRRVIETDMDGLGPKLLRQWKSARRLIAMADTSSSPATSAIQ